MNEPIDYAAEYDNSGRVENSRELIDAFIDDAQEYREHSGVTADYDVSYGPETRNRMDIFWPSNADMRETCPIVMFIHGGYWRMLDRSAFSHLADGLLAHNIAVAIPSYTLCPDIKIDGIINEMRRACLTLYQNYDRKITVTGHSAGGHLAACMLATNWESIHHTLPFDLVSSGMGISGLYDLLPLLQTPVNDAVRMSQETAELSSPVRWLPEGLLRFDAWVGGDESNEFHRQSRELAEKWSLLGTPTRYIPVPGENHFTVVRALADPKSAMVERIIDLVEQPLGEPELGMPDDHELAAEIQDFEGLAPTLASEADFSGIKPMEVSTEEQSQDDEIPYSLEEEAPEAGESPFIPEPEDPTEEPERPVRRNRFAGTD